MIPSITANRSASWKKHIHSLSGLPSPETGQDDRGVSLDDTPFLIDGSTPDQTDIDWQQARRVAGQPSLPSWSVGKLGSVASSEAEGGGRWLFQTVSRTRGEGRESSTLASVSSGLATSELDEGHHSHHIPGAAGGDSEGDDGYVIKLSGGAHEQGSPAWWQQTPNTTELLLLDGPQNASEWLNDTLMSWKSESSPALNVSVTCTNLSFNGSGCLQDEAPPFEVTPEGLALCLLLLFFAVSTIFGNGLVIVAVARERYLHTVTNYFIMSLAVADCLVGALVMPFSALYDSFDYWPFGPDFCDVWRSFDVLASTASILNLCVISLDRYWAITDPFSYPTRMSPKRACMLIALVWVCSALISFPAIAWWRAVSEPHPVGACPFTEDLSYLVFSSTISFYGPLFVMVFTYFRIYRAATEQTRSLKLGQKLVSSLGDGEMELTLRIHRGGGGSSSNSTGNGVHRTHYAAGKTYSCSQENGGINHPQNTSQSLEDSEACPLGASLHEGTSPDSSTKVVSRNLKNFSISRKLCKFAKEKKAAKTLGIVMGVFIVCWLPFFVTNLLSGLCGERCIREPALVDGVVTWLGWINSAMNPVIYACWAKDFRRAFTRILCSCCPRRCRKRYQTRWKGGIAQIIVTPVVSTLSTSFIKSAEPRPCVPSAPYTPVAPALASALVAATSGTSK
ncbi:dopamine receptor 2-like [Portunus trituberculatus]|uniref:dopamine receptor 2-like n=1 Tax=Portunus trituberculatus TaxID=210409 RepID=UPI001E1CF425|nr:dopamine receptor 2-like [Portunus trituberculatus]